MEPQYFLGYIFTLFAWLVMNAWEGHFRTTPMLRTLSQNACGWKSLQPVDQKPSGMATKKLKCKTTYKIILLGHSYEYHWVLFFQEESDEISPISSHLMVIVDFSFQPHGVSWCSTTVFVWHHTSSISPLELG